MPMTYVNNIFIAQMPIWGIHRMIPEYGGQPLVPSRAAMSELMTHGADLYDVQKVLEDGYDCHHSRRARGVLERCPDRRGMTVKVVVAASYNISMECDVWVITHFGVISRRK
jgi:hypothetical protein